MAFIVAALIVWVATAAQTYLVEWVGQRALADLRLAIFAHLQRLPVSFYERRPTGVLISRMTNDVEALDTLVTDSVVTLFQGGLTLLGTLVILLTFDLQLALITFIMLPLIGIASLVFRIASADAYRRTRETIGHITGYLQESLSGVRVVPNLRPGAQTRRRVRGTERAQPRREHDDGEHERRLLPGDRVRLRRGHGRGPSLRWQPGSAWRDRARCAGRLPRSPEQLLRPDHATLAAVHDLPIRHGRARQDLRTAGRAARDARARRR